MQPGFAVTVPERRRSTSQQHLYQRMAGTTLVWQGWRFDGTADPKFSGTAIELDNVAARTTSSTDNMEETVDGGARRAGSHLSLPHGHLTRPFAMHYSHYHCEALVHHAGRFLVAFPPLGAKPNRIPSPSSGFNADSNS